MRNWTPPRRRPTCNRARRRDRPYCCPDTIPSAKPGGRASLYLLFYCASTAQLLRPGLLREDEAVFGPSNRRWEMKRLLVLAVALCAGAAPLPALAQIERPSYE